MTHSSVGKSKDHRDALESNLCNPLIIDLGLCAVSCLWNDQLLQKQYL